MANRSRELVKWAAVGTAVSLLFSACAPAPNQTPETVPAVPIPQATIDPLCTVCQLVATKNAPSPTKTPETQTQLNDLASITTQKLGIPQNMITEIIELENKEAKDRKVLTANMANNLLLPIPIKTGVNLKMSAAAAEAAAAGQFALYVGASNALTNFTYWYAVFTDIEWASTGFIGDQGNPLTSPAGGILARNLTFNYFAKPYLEIADVPIEVQDQAKFLFLEGRYQNPATCFAKAYELVAERQGMTVVQYVTKMETGKTTLINPGQIQPTPERSRKKPEWKLIERTEASVWQVDDHTVWKIYDYPDRGQKVYNVSVLQRYQELTSQAAELLDGKRVPIITSDLGSPTRYASLKLKVEPIGKVFVTNDGYAAIEQRYVDGPRLNATSWNYMRTLQETSASLNEQLNTGDIISLVPKNIIIVNGDTLVITDLLANVAELANEVKK